MIYVKKKLLKLVKITLFFYLFLAILCPKTVLAVNLDGTPIFKSQIGNLPSDTISGAFHRAVTISIDSSDNVYIGDSNGHISKYNSSGEFLIHWGGPGDSKIGNGEFAGKVYVADKSINGNIYVSDYSNNRIQIFDSSGNYLSQFGSYGAGNGQFWGPAYITIDSSGNLYVAENWNFRIQKFDSSGNYLTQWGGWGAGNGKFVYPQGLYIDSEDNIYVSDMTRVQVFGYPIPAITTTTASAPNCSDKKPGSAPDLFQINTTNNSAKLFFTPASDPVNKYNISYGEKENNLIFGVEYSQDSSNGVLSYTINSLSPNTTYYFKIRGGNGCMPGDWSNIRSAKTNYKTNPSPTPHPQQTYLEANINPIRAIKAKIPNITNFFISLKLNIFMLWEVFLSLLHP